MNIMKIRQPDGSIVSIPLRFSGADGVGITEAIINDKGELVLTYSNGTEANLGSVIGPTGPKGDKGDQGEAGPAGADGVQGPKGDTGAQGPIGPAGEDGTPCTHSWDGTILTITSASGTSSADLKGEKGDKGDKGETGETGKQGETGPTGPAGADGYTPVKGTDYFTPEDVAQITNDVSSLIGTHNTATDSHNDIRILVKELTDRLNALANSTDEDLDQMAEIVEYIKDNKELIDSITTSKVSVTDIIDNLTTNVANKPLSAAQGVALKALIDAIVIPTALAQLTDDATHRLVTDNEKATWNGKANKSDIPDVSKFVTEDDLPTVPTTVGAFINDSGYVTNADLNQRGYLTSIPDRYATNESVGNRLFDYEKTTSAASKLAEAKAYTDSQIAATLGSDVTAAYNAFKTIQTFLNTDTSGAAALVSDVNTIKSNYATKDYVRSSGSNTQATGANATAEGEGTVASGRGAHAQGGKTVSEYPDANGVKRIPEAAGLFSHSGGINTRAEGDYSRTDGNATTALGMGSVAEGHYTIASGEYSRADGERTVASGKHASASGHNTRATGEDSRTNGRDTIASALYSYAGGLGTKATVPAQRSIGKYNSINENALFIVGNGSSDSDRKNAFEVLTSGAAHVQAVDTSDYSVVNVAYLNAVIAELRAEIAALKGE